MCVPKDFWNKDNVRQRFWRRVNIPNAEARTCWEWGGGLQRNGYGRVEFPGRKIILAHRFAWQDEHGPIPEGKWVLHKCDNRRCVRPTHLYLGTIKENTRDMVERGRVSHHKGNPKLSIPQVREIRALRMAGARINDLANRFGVHRHCIRKVVHGYTWADVT